MEESLNARYHVTDASLQLKKEWIGLDNGAIRSLSALESWSKEGAPMVAKEAIEKQLSAPGAFKQFERLAKQNEQKPEALRTLWETETAEYLRLIFQEAAAGGHFGAGYYGRRLQLGQRHSRLGIPPKWFFGRQSVLLTLLSEKLGKANLHRPLLVVKAIQTIAHLFAYDAQAYMEAYLLDTMECMGCDTTLTHQGEESADEIGSLRDSFSGGLEEIAAAIGNGDLSIEVPVQSEKDTVRLALRNIILRLRDFVGDLQHNLEISHQTAEYLADTMGQCGQAITQIATAMQEVTSGQIHQAESTERTAYSTQQMSQQTDIVAQGTESLDRSSNEALEITENMMDMITQVISNVQTGAEQATETAQKAEEGALAVKNNIEVMSRIRHKVGLSAAKVAEMGSHSEQIGSIVEAIEDISSQTNLLALNAAIEAARAGEHGKGFAVVADEVRKLAEKSSISTKEIGALIRGIQQTVSEAVSAMEEGAEEVELGMSGVSAAGAVFEGILSAVEVVSQQVAAISVSAEEMNMSSFALMSAMSCMTTVAVDNAGAVEVMKSEATNVTDAIENIASISEQNSACAEEINAATEELTAQIQEVTVGAQRLKDLTESLTAKLAAFELPKSTAQTISDSPELRMAA